MNFRIGQLVGRSVVRRLVMVVLGLVVLMTLILVTAMIAVVPMPVPVVQTDLADMVRVDGGVYPVGGRVGSIAVETFYIDRFEVTVGAWRDYEAETGRRAKILASDEIQAVDSPMRDVTAAEAEAYLTFRLKELPSNVQWQVASLGPGGSERPWGSGFLPDAANIRDFWDRPGMGWRGRGVTRVGTFELGKSAVGAYDMIGNVWEWTRSGIDDLIQGISPERETALADARVMRRDHRILRGGSFRTPFRQRFEVVEPATTYGFDIGFRGVVTATEISTQRKLTALIGCLGYRDPLRYVFRTRPAMRALEREGPQALPALRRVRRKTDDERLQTRLDAVIGRIENRADRRTSSRVVTQERG